jgi:hypothetical protein
VKAIINEKTWNGTFSQDQCYISPVFDPVKRRVQWLHNIRTA